MPEYSPEFKAMLAMTSETIGKDLLGALVTEIRLLPDVWSKLPQEKQQDLIDRLSNRVKDSIRFAVYQIAANGRAVIVGELDTVTIKDGVKALVKISSSAPNLGELYDAQGKAVLVVVADAAQHMGGMDEIHGESDQRALNLGKEYAPDSDGEGMDTAANDDDGVIDVQAIEHQPTTLQKQKVWAAGYVAAENGETLSDCPRIETKLCTEWVKGWKYWHYENKTDWWKEHGSDDEAVYLESVDEEEA